jgi:hypothetical protein
MQEHGRHGAATSEVWNTHSGLEVDDLGQPLRKPQSIGASADP